MIFNDEDMKMEYVLIESEYASQLEKLVNANIKEGWQPLGGAFDYASQQISDAIDCTGSDDFFDKLTDAEGNGTSLKMDFDCCGRDGMFDRQQLYAVWEQSDVVLLIERLKLCLDNQ